MILSAGPSSTGESEGFSTSAAVDGLVVLLWPGLDGAASVVAVENSLYPHALSKTWPRCDRRGRLARHIVKIDVFIDQFEINIVILGLSAHPKTPRPESRIQYSNKFAEAGRVQDSNLLMRASLYITSIHATARHRGLALSAG